MPTVLHPKAQPFTIQTIYKKAFVPPRFCTLSRFPFLLLSSPALTALLLFRTTAFSVPVIVLVFSRHTHYPLYFHCLVQRNIFKPSNLSTILPFLPLRHLLLRTEQTAGLGIPEFGIDTVLTILSSPLLAVSCPHKHQKIVCIGPLKLLSSS